MILSNGRSVSCGFFVIDSFAPGDLPANPSGQIGQLLTGRVGLPAMETRFPAALTGAPEAMELQQPEQAIPCKDL